MKTWEVSYSTPASRERCRAAAAKLGPCPRCEAPAGEPCVTPKRVARYPHAERCYCSDITSKNGMAVECGCCGAVPGEYCRHKAR